MEENAIQVNGWLMINVDEGVKAIMYLKKVMFGMQLNIIGEMGNI